MARPRADTGNFTKEPHSVSLKVLRLVRPSLAQQYPLPPGNIAKIPPHVSLAQPAEGGDQEFLLTSNLSLPPAFGSAYVGETFSCSLCANNELLGETASKIVSNVHLTADMQTPSQQQIPLSAPVGDQAAESILPYGESLQQIVRFDLKEEGNHVLVVNLSYTEASTSSDTTPLGGRQRSFRKLYQFQAQPCLSVRTKATEFAGQQIADKSLGPYGRSTLARYVLEAQLENVAEGGIVLEHTQLIAHPPFKSASLNWDIGDSTNQDYPFLTPRDVLQLAFLIEQEAEKSEGLDELKANLKRDGRTALGQIALEWRSSMGERGHLTTGMLFSRKRT